MPQLGESVAEGTIGKWLKQPGDHVDKYEPLVEVVTDKVNAEVPSPFEGILREILVEEGATVPNNAEIAVIETADDGAGKPASSSAAAARAAADSSDAPKPNPTPSPPTDPDTAPTPTVAAGPAGSDERGPTEMAAAASARSAPPTARAASASAPPATADPDARMTPAVRRLLREHELSPAQITGTGGGGRITREDVLKAVEAMRTGAMPSASPAPGGNGARPASVAPSGPAAAPGRSTPAPAGSRSGLPSTATIEFPDGADEVLVPATQMRKGIAAQMTRALQAPHAYVQM